MPQPFARRFNLMRRGAAGNISRPGQLISFPAGGQLLVEPPVYLGGFAPPAGTVGVPYSYDLAPLFTGDALAFSANVLPAGLSISGSVITGTPTTVEAPSVTVTATNAAGSASTDPATLTINPAAPAYLGGFAPPAGTVGVAYNYDLAPLFTGDALTFSANVLPAGLSISGSAITGTPTTAEAPSVTVTATNVSGSDSTEAATLTINPAPPVQVDRQQLLDFLQSEGWTPDTSDPDAWYFPQTDDTLTAQMVNTCNFDDLSPALAHDVREGVQLQGFCL